MHDTTSQRRDSLQCYRLELVDLGKQISHVCSILRTIPNVALAKPLLEGLESLAQASARFELVVDLMVLSVDMLETKTFDVAMVSLQNHIGKSSELLAAAQEALIDFPLFNRAPAAATSRLS